MNNKILIIDGSAIIYRAYHALPQFTSKKGVPTNAVYGFIKMLLSLINKTQTEYLVVAMDTPKPTFRKKLFKEYQSQRPKMPDDFKIQIPLIQEFLKLAQIHFISQEGYEADDVIGTLAKDKKLIDYYTYIVTGDKDILQLTDKKTTIIMPVKGVSVMHYYDPEEVESKFGVRPEQIVDYKALVGDSSDNYPGVKGIGPKKAAVLLNKYINLNQIYQNLAEIDKHTQTLLIEYKKDALISKTLAQIKTDIKYEFKIEKSKLIIDKPSKELLIFLDSLSLTSIKKQFLKQSKKDKPVIRVDKKHQNQLSFF